MLASLKTRYNRHTIDILMIDAICKRSSLKGLGGFSSAVRIVPFLNTTKFDLVVIEEKVRSSGFSVSLKITEATCCDCFCQNIEIKWVCDSCPRPAMTQVSATTVKVASSGGGVQSTVSTIVLLSLLFFVHK